MGADDRRVIPIDPDLAPGDLGEPLLPDISLNKRERDVVLALFEGYLLPSPRRQPWPRTYQQAAQRLGKPWTKDAVRKEAERLKLRLSRTGPPWTGSAPTTTWPST